MAREKGGPRYVWGICTNLDKDGNGTPCPNCKSKERLKLSIRNDFVCPECGEPLTKVKGPTKTPWKLIVIIAAAVVVLAGVGYVVYSFMGGSKIDKIKLDKKSVTLVVGQKDVIKATVVDKDGKEIKDAKVTYKWTVKDEKVASITQGGEVAALKKGKTSITVKIEGDDKHRATCQVEVKPKKIQIPGGGGENPVTPEVLVSSLSVVNAKISIKKGETASLGMSVQPENATEEISVESSKPEVASIEDGVIKANKAGKTVIKISTEKSGKSVTVEVNVKDEGTDGGNGWGKVNLGYGVYEGERKNYKPHGHGTIRYTQRHQIVSWKDYEASPGDTFEGNFRDGKISGLGYWKHNGNVTAIQ